VTRENELTAELECARQLLLTPHAAAMRDCQLSLERAAGILRNHAARREDRAQVKRTVATIRFLLERARNFWDGRRVSAGPGIQYGSGGQLVPAQLPSRFTIEV
jgi:hypothetical protein